MEREKTSKSWGDYGSTIWEQRYVSEPVETKYSDTSANEDNSFRNHIH